MSLKNYLVVLLTRIELVARPYQGRVLPLYYRSMLIGLAGGDRTPIYSLGVSGIIHYTTARLAGPERFELPTSSFEDLLSIQLNYGPL